MIEKEGMFRKDGTIYKVQRAVHGSGRLYAKALIQNGSDARFEYASGAIYKLTEAHRMTLAEAKEFGALYGVCCVCGRLLTDENSIEAGIGPVCAQGGKGGFAWKVELYAEDIGQTEETVEAAKVNEVVQEQSLRKVTMGANKFGPVFQIRFGYDDPKFRALKDEIKGWEWSDTKRKWNPVAKAWEVDANSDLAIAIVKHFALQNEFEIAPEVEAKFGGLASRPAVEATQEVVAQEIDRQTAGLPMTFSDLVKEV